MRPRWKKLILIAPLAILGMLLFVAIGGEIVQCLWNWLLPTLFGWRELTLLAGARDCWRCAGSSSAGSDCTVSGRSNMRRRMEERCGRMTPEERERFRQRMRERCGFGSPTAREPGAVNGLRCSWVWLLQFAEIHLVGFHRVEVAGRPARRVLQRVRLDHHVAGNQLLGLGERPVDHADAVAGVLVAPAPGAGAQGFGGEMHSAARGLVDQARHLRALLRRQGQRPPPRRPWPCAAPCSAAWSRSRGLGTMPMSHASVTGRMSISTSPSTAAWREAHSIASSSDRDAQDAEPGGQLVVSLRTDPLMTVRAPPENLRRTPCELARRPSAPSSTPAFASSPSSVPTRAISSGLGIVAPTPSARWSCA